MFPGFAVGAAYEETRLLDLLKSEAYGIGGIAANLFLNLHQNRY